MKRKEAARDVSVSANAAVEILRSGTRNGRYALAYVDAVEVIERHRFVDVAHEAGQWADLLRRLGLQPGARVIVLAGRDRHWRSALLGVLEAGGVATPCAADMPSAELRVLAQEGRAAAVLSASPRPELVELLGIPVLCPGDLDARQRRYGRATPSHEPRPDDFALIVRRRHGLGGEAHTHEALLDRASAAARALGIRRGGAFWCTAADGSAESVWLTLAAWHAGVEVVVVEAELAHSSRLELLHRLPGGAVWFSDDDYAALAAADVASWVDLTHIRHALTSGEPGAGAMAFQRAFGVEAVAAAVADELADATAPARVADVVPLPVTPTLRVAESQTGDSGRAAQEAAEEKRRLAEAAALAEEKHREEERLRAEKERAQEEQRRREQDAEEKRREEERLRAEKETRRREEQQAKERQKEEQRRRKEEAEQRELAAKAARAEAARRAAEEKRREKERQRAEKEARRREAHAEKERQKEEQRRRNEEAKQRKLAEETARAEEERRTEEEKRREEEHLRALEEARRRGEQQAREREREDARRRRNEAKQREQSEKAARAEERRRRDEERRRSEEEEERRRREEAKSRERTEREADQGLRRDEGAERAAAAGEPALVGEAKPSPAPSPRDSEGARTEGLPPEVLSRLGEYGVTTPVRDGGSQDADARDEPERARTPDERREAL